MDNSRDSDKYIRIGPINVSRHGKSWDYFPEGSITQIIIRHNDRCVKVLRFWNKENNGELGSYVFGGLGEQDYCEKERTDKVNLDSPGEYLTGIKVCVGNYESQEVIASLSFLINVTCYGPFGNYSRGHEVSIPVEGGEVVGFRIKAYQYINSIGIYVQAKCPTSSLVQEYSQMINRICGHIGPREAGPWGTPGGKPWDDGVFPAVKQIYLELKGDDIDGHNKVVAAIQFLYQGTDGALVRSPRYGQSMHYPPNPFDGPMVSHVANGVEKLFVLDDISSCEEFVGIEGFYGPLDGERILERITSLTFYTKNKAYGPYGSKIGTFFSSPPSGGKIVGFFVRGGVFLNAIGLHMDYK